MAAAFRVMTRPHRPRIAVRGPPSDAGRRQLADGDPLRPGGSSIPYRPWGTVTLTVQGAPVSLTGHGRSITCSIQGAGLAAGQGCSLPNGDNAKGPRAWASDLRRRLINRERLAPMRQPSDFRCAELTVIQAGSWCYRPPSRLNTGAGSAPVWSLGRCAASYTRNAALSRTI